jgi:hypothetical protein
MSRKLQNASKDASWARLFPNERITLLVAHLFDNRDKAAGKRGRSDYALKLFAYHRGWNIHLSGDADWWRVVQLIEPKVVLSWAKAKHAEAGMSEDQFRVYEHVAISAMEAAKSGEYEFVKMGHISSPPGTQYLIGQFVYVHKTKDGELQAIIFNDGDGLLLDTWGVTRKAGPIRKPGTPTHFSLYDPGDILGKQKAQDAALEARQAQRAASGQVETEGRSMTTEEALRGFLSGGL